jgi:hypothetical protein
MPEAVQRVANAISSKPVSGTLTIIGDDPREAVAPLFANFAAVSHVGNEVQLEFIFLDINTLANQIEQVKRGEVPADLKIQGKTIAKIVVPAASFVQLKNHLLGLFDKLERAADENKRGKETSTEGDNGD